MAPIFAEKIGAAMVAEMNCHLVRIASAVKLLSGVLWVIEAASIAGFQPFFEPVEYG